MAVQDGTVDRPIVPIENALEGSVARHARHARARGRATCASRQRWSTRSITASSRASELSLSQVERVVSHPQATAQCARFLREHLPRRGARERALHRGRRACPCARRRTTRPSRSVRGLAAELYDCHVVADERRGPPRQRHALRAGWRAADAVGEPGADAKTSIVFWGGGDQSPGWLVDVLSELSEPRRQPHAHRVASAQNGPRALHVLRRSRRSRRRRHPSATRSTRWPDTSRSCAYSALTGGPSG